MKNDSSEAMAHMVIDAVKDNMRNESADYSISNINEDRNNKEFTVIFEAFEYFWIGIDFGKGSITAYIVGKRTVVLENLTDWWEEIDINAWIKKLKEELMLRITDKFLKAKGYIE